MDNLTQLRTAQAIVLNATIAKNKELKSGNVSIAIASMKEAISELDKAIRKPVKHGEFHGI